MWRRHVLLPSTPGSWEAVSVGTASGLRFAWRAEHVPGGEDGVQEARGLLQGQRRSAAGRRRAGSEPWQVVQALPRTAGGSPVRLECQRGLYAVGRLSPTCGGGRA